VGGGGVFFRFLGVREITKTRASQGNPYQLLVPTLPIVEFPKLSLGS